MSASRSRSAASAKSSPLQRFGEEIRAACRSVAARGEAAPADRPFAALGEWLGTVRQPQGEAALSPRRRALAFVEGPRGDLSRTHIIRVKGDRAHLDDGMFRSGRFH